MPDNPVIVVGGTTAGAAVPVAVEAGHVDRLGRQPVATIPAGCGG